MRLDIGGNVATAHILPIHGNNLILTSQVSEDSCDVSGTFTLSDDEYVIDGDKTRHWFSHDNTEVSPSYYYFEDNKLVFSAFESYYEYTKR